jgi:uncharacterized membrane protein YeaQ/YmgE (transglycosylase-associated protein family)
MIWVFWALSGWCGTPWRRFPPPPPPNPDPWLSLRVVGIIGGLVGGWAFGRIFQSDPMPGLSAVHVAATCVGAFIGGRVLSELASFGFAGKANRG